MSNHPLYSTWKNMRQRCNNPNRPDFKNYGGRGIKVCEEWNSFLQFCEDMGVKPEGTSLDRINNDNGYSKDNCRWATRTEQNRNSRQCILNEYVVNQIRQEPRRGPGGRGGTGQGYKLKELANKYQVSYRAVRAVLDSQNWVNQ